MLLSTLLLTLPLVPLLLAQSTLPKCAFDNPAAAALHSIIQDCHDSLAANPDHVISISPASPETVCYRIARDRSSISEIVVHQRLGHYSGCRDYEGGYRVRGEGYNG